MVLDQSVRLIVLFFAHWYRFIELCYIAGVALLNVDQNINKFKCLKVNFITSYISLVSGLILHSDYYYLLSVKLKNGKETIHVCRTKKNYVFKNFRTISRKWTLFPKLMIKKDLNIFFNHMSWKFFLHNQEIKKTNYPDRYFFTSSGTVGVSVSSLCSSIIFFNAIISFTISVHSE